jgi:Lipocalin-like domain
MVNPKLFNQWILTGKENNGIRVYSAKKIALGNTHQIENEDSFEIKENGEFVKYMTSPEGNPSPYVGRYEIQGDTLHSYFKNHYLDSMFTIVSLHNNVLRIR